LENLARIYYQAILVGEPIILSDAEIYQTVERFKNYWTCTGVIFCVLGILWEEVYQSLLLRSAYAALSDDAGYQDAQA